MKRLSVALLLLGLAACQPSSNETKIVSEPETLENVCKSVIAALTTSNSHKSMFSSHAGDISDVSYNRESDGKLWKAQCKYYPSSPTTGSVVWRGVDIFEPGGGPGVWREREYDQIVNYWAEKDDTNSEAITLEILETGANKELTGERKVEKYKFESIAN